MAYRPISKLVTASSISSRSSTGAATTAPKCGEPFTVASRPTHQSRTFRLPTISLRRRKRRSHAGTAAAKRWSSIRKDALRAVLSRDGTAYLSALDSLHPERAEKGRILSTVFLCKAALAIRLRKDPPLQDIAEDLRRRLLGSHPITLNWGSKFADRFTPDEARVLWDRFSPLRSTAPIGRRTLCAGLSVHPHETLFQRNACGLQHGGLHRQLDGTVVPLRRRLSCPFISPKTPDVSCPICCATLRPKHCAKSVCPMPMPH